MEKLEKLHEESNLQKEINEALKNFSAEEMALKSSITSKNKDIKERTKEEMKEELDSWELRKRIDTYIQINGQKIAIVDLDMDDNKGLLKMKYKVMFDNVEKEISSYFKIVGEKNSSYLQFVSDTHSVEFFEEGGKTVVKPENGYSGGKMFDINIVQSPSKGIDIRTIENQRKTKEKILTRIEEHKLTPNFTADTFKDATLENTKIETLQYTQLGEEIIPEDKGYYRAIFMRDGEKYREIGKVYFDEKGELDKTKTESSQTYSLLNVELNIKVNLGNNTFDIENINKLKEQIKTQREILSTYIENSEFGDYTIFKGFNREKWGKRKQTKLLWLDLADNMYTFKRGGEKGKETINFGFTKNNELQLKDISGKEVEPLAIKIEKSNGKEEVKNIITDKNKKQLLIQKSNEEVANNQPKPDLENKPSLLTKDYLFNQNADFSKIEYHTKKGELITKIPATKTEENEWKLETLSQDVHIEDLYKDITKKTKMDFRNINIFENDIFEAFSELRETSKVTVSARKTIRVLDKTDVYKYYTVEQKKVWEPFVCEIDEELYKESERIMNIVLENIKTIDKIENTQLKYRDKKEKVEKNFSQWVGGSGFLPIATTDKIEFLKNTKDKTTLTKECIRGSKTANIENFPVNFIIEKNKITVKEKIQTINNEKYTTKLKEEDKKLTLRFDDIE